MFNNKNNRSTKIISPTESLTKMRVNNYYNNDNNGNVGCGKKKKKKKKKDEKKKKKKNEKSGNEQKIKIYMNIVDKCQTLISKGRIDLKRGQLTVHREDEKSIHSQIDQTLIQFSPVLKKLIILFFHQTQQKAYIELHSEKDIQILKKNYSS